MIRLSAPGLHILLLILILGPTALIAIRLLMAAAHVAISLIGYATSAPFCCVATAKGIENARYKCVLKTKAVLKLGFMNSRLKLSISIDRNRSKPLLVSKA
jgi:hypothetical protein